MKVQATKNLELGDLIADFDLDGTFAIVKMTNGQILDLRTLDTTQVQKSLKKGSLRKAIDAGDLTEVTPAATELNVDELQSKLSEVLEWVISNDVAIQFLPINGAGVDNPIAGAIAGTDAELAITDGDGTLDPFNSSVTVVVTITGGGAAGKEIRYKDTDGEWSSWGAGPVTVTFVSGMGYLQVKGSGAGTVTLGLSGGNSALNVLDTATITLS